jgi:hypothetical protein
MVAVPAVTPVTSPVVALTVATAGVLLDQEPPVAVEANVVVALTQMFCIPEIEPASGGMLTVKLRVMTESQPLAAVMVRL